jgi:hypothetical protein
MKIEEWENIENKLSFPGNVVKLIIDGYNIDLQVQYENKNWMKLVIAVYVNGKMSVEYLNPENEICIKFMCPHKKCIATKQEIEKFTSSKKMQQELKNKYTYTHYTSYWSSFRRMKNHFIKNNTSIELTSTENEM